MPILMYIFLTGAGTILSDRGRKSKKKAKPRKRVK